MTGTKTNIALIALIITVLTMAIAYGAGQQRIKDEIQDVKDGMIVFEEIYEQVSDDHEPWADMVEGKLIDNSIEHERLFITLEVISEDVKEIKQDVKDIKEKQ